MKLKEAFRYQSFLNQMVEWAVASLRDPQHAFKVTRKHLYSQSHPGDQDEIEEIDNGEFYKDDDVADFLEYLIREKEELTVAITECKQNLNFDIDAAIQTNKVRQRTIDALKILLGYKGGVVKRNERGYRFNAEGNQVSFYYKVEDTKEECFDREKVKKMCKELSEKSEKISAEIEVTYVTEVVNFDPSFDADGSLEETMDRFLSVFK